MPDLVDVLAADPARAALVLDFDGTLAPIVEDPATSAMEASLGPVLADLAQDLAVVAVVSGRPASFLGERVDVPGVRRLGLYGLEEWRDGAGVPRPEAAPWKEAVERSRDVLARVVGGVDGVIVEDKGLAVAVHWRKAADRAAAERAAVDAVQRLARDSGLAVEPGKMVVELRPPVDWDKGSTVRAVAAEAGTTTLAYVGDDVGDLPAFAAVRELGGLAVAVEHGDETPAALLEAADVVLAGIDEVGAALVALRDRLRASDG